MCGFVSLHGSGQDLAPYQEVLERMLATLVHRGPDGEGLTHVDKQALFGHRRLAVIDLVQGRSHALCLWSLYTVFNGEIYNYLELRRELQQKGGVFGAILTLKSYSNCLSNKARKALPSSTECLVFT